MACASHHLPFHSQSCLRQFEEDVRFLLSIHQIDLPVRGSLCFSVQKATMSNPVDNSSAPRPRNRRLPSRSQGTTSSTSLYGPSPNTSKQASRETSPFKTSLLGSSGRNSPVNTTINRASGLLDIGWSSVSEFAYSLFGEQENSGKKNGKPSQTDLSKRKAHPWRAPFASDQRNRIASSQPGIRDVAAGAISERETALRAMKTASVLESHDGVNGGLDVTGRFKRRTSDENLSFLASRGATTATTEQIQDEGCLVYIHDIAATDTYPGLVLKYRCRDDAIKKANGLSNVNHLYIRRHIFVPVDACEIKGRPCEPPSYANAGKVDLLAPTPGENTEASSLEGPAQARGSKNIDYFGLSPLDIAKAEQKKEERLWEHVRWVKIDGFNSPVQIGRISRKSLGYYPPHRKKNIVSATASEISTPRQSIDLQNPATPCRSQTSTEIMNSPSSLTSRRREDSVMSSSRHSVSMMPGRTRSSAGSFSVSDNPRPVWMRGPGGIGTLGQNVKAPGPQDDALNKWARKHFSQLAVDKLPSMSVLGSETAHFGFTKDGESAEIAQGGDGYPHLEGAPADGGGIKLDKMAIGIEAWLRGAWQNRGSASTPMLGPRRREESDLIELEDTSDDGRLTGSLPPHDHMLNTLAGGSGQGNSWGRSMASSSGWSVSGSMTQGGINQVNSFGKDRKSD